MKRDDRPIHNTDPPGNAFSALKALVQSGRPLIYLCSSEEGRIRHLVEDAAEHLFSPAARLWTWSLTLGLQGPGREESSTQRMPARTVLEHIARQDGPAVFHLVDFHEFLDDPDVRRRLRDLYGLCLDTRKFVFLSSPLRAIPQGLDQQMAFLELPPPDLEELLGFVDRELELLGQHGRASMKDDHLYQIGRALQGLTLDEARHAIRRALSVDETLGPDAIPHLLEEKRLVVNKTGLVQFVADGTVIDHVGGLETLKHWLFERRKLFQERESIAAEIVPKGLLVMGVSGCGKSLSVKAVASCFGLPLYRIDMIEVFSGRHGNPERAFVEACRKVEAVAPAVVWFDEIEMGLTAQTGEASSNLGRLFAFFLTWMQEKSRGLFVAATANRIDLLPAEMIRKGRFDEVFFIDLPSEEERTEIFRIHVTKRHHDPDKLEVQRLRKISAGWTGAEIEQCVVSALTAARLEDRAPIFEDLHRAAQSIVPLSKTMKEQVDHIRSWAFDRAVRASPR